MTFFQVVCICALFFVAVIAESKDPEKELFELADLDFDNMGPDMSKPINIEVGAESVLFVESFNLSLAFI